MTTATVEARETGRTPWSLWAVGVAGLLWNGFGGYDYMMTQTRGAAYLREMGFTEAQTAYFLAMPAWMEAVWAIGVWGGVLGTVLLLVRSRFAVHAFAASLAGLLVSLLYTYLLSDGLSVMGPGSLGMNAVVLAGCLFFLWYAARQAKRGVLR